MHREWFLMPIRDCATCLPYWTSQGHNRVVFPIITYLLTTPLSPLFKETAWLKSHLTTYEGLDTCLSLSSSIVKHLASHISFVFWLRNFFPPVLPERIMEIRVISIVWTAAVREQANKYITWCLLDWFGSLLSIILPGMCAIKKTVGRHLFLERDLPTASYR